MSSALGGLSAAKRRRGIISQPVAKQGSFTSEILEPQPTMKQVNPIEMLKIHELRIHRIETMPVISLGGEVSDSDKDSSQDILESIKNTLVDHETMFRDFKSTILTLQSLAISTSQSLEKMKIEVESLKKDALVRDIGNVSLNDKLTTISE